MKLFSFILLLGVAGCSLSDNELIGAGTGAAVGAGAGVAIGEAVAGEPLYGGLIGAAVAAPLGAAIGNAYDGYKERKRMEAVDKEILENNRAIIDQQKQLDNAHRRVLEDSQRFEPREDTKEYIYTGM